MMESVCNGKLELKLVRAVMSSARTSNGNQAAKFAPRLLFQHLCTNEPRYFRSQKLDYPNAETSKASKKYVKAMKRLEVSLAVDLIMSC